MLIPIIDLVNYYGLNDWFLLAMIVTLVLMLIIMGPYRAEYADSFMSMFRFRSPDGEVSFPLLSTIENIIIYLLSCISIGLAVGVYSQDLMEEGTSSIYFLLWYSSMIVGFFLLKLVCYTVVNKILYKRQVITLKPARWNCFFVMTFSVCAFLMLMFSILVIFLNIHLFALFVFAYLMRILTITGRIFKMKTALFKNSRSNLGFILYLCAFEIAPVIFEFIISSTILGLI